MFTPYGCTDAYSAQIEASLSTEDRYDQIQRIAFNLTLNHAHLTSTYDPTDLLRLNDDMLAENSYIESEKCSALTKYERYKTLTREDFLSNEGLSGSQCIVCRFCGQQSIEFTTKQTRSADEGSTVFVMCTNPKCKKRWKM